MTVFPEIVPEVAVIVDVPAATAVASPLVSTIVAAAVSDEDHVTDDVMSAVVLSEYVPVAVNCWSAATVMLGLAGVTAMEERVTALLLPQPAKTVTPKIKPAATNIAISFIIPLFLSSSHYTNKIQAKA